MPYSGLQPFISKLKENNELIRIKEFADPILEIAEITDRIVKAGGKALLFENNGTPFPLLINAFGSDKRIALAFGRENPYDAGTDIEKLFAGFISGSAGLKGKINAIPELLRLSSYLPVKSGGRGTCQEVVSKEPDLGMMPILKCWPFDGGRFITLPMVHTMHPETGSTNVGMYRMQVIGKDTTGMHWQRHKTGANHFEAWKKAGKIMPVSVALGGDPVYTYASTAPLPENLNEYILAGFLRRKKVKLVKCITNDLYVPEDTDFIIEGFVDPSENLVYEGPFGDHTGFYSLADWYPRFHVTCITHRKNAIYPATIVGIPPQEDAFLAKATEKIFLPAVKMALLPEIIDFHMPDAGTAHNMVLVKINKSYPGQGMKVISSLFGAGQMMFSKYIIVVNGNIDIRNYSELARHIFIHFDPSRDILFTRGPLDVLDHASDRFSFGGKAGFDATEKLPEESGDIENPDTASTPDLSEMAMDPSWNTTLLKAGIPLIVVTANNSSDTHTSQKVVERLKDDHRIKSVKLVLLTDSTVNAKDLYLVTWQVLANSDPVRDLLFIYPSCLLIDGTAKFFRKVGFNRKWPNVVCADEETIARVDSRWQTYGFTDKLPSPSVQYRKLLRKGKDEVTG